MVRYLGNACLKATCQDGLTKLVGTPNMVWRTAGLLIDNDLLIPLTCQDTPPTSAPVLTG